MKSTSAIEICIAVYQRPHNVPGLLEQLKQQTVQNFQVSIWNNSSKKLDISGFPADRIQVVESVKNVGSCAKFKLVPKTKGSPIIFLDDDEVIGKDFVEYCYEQHKKFGKDCILGWYSKIWTGESYWDVDLRLPYGTEVDYIGPAGMVIDRAIFDREPLLQNIPEPFVRIEGVYLCYLARMRYGMKMIKINSASRTVVDGKDQWRTIDKEKAFRELRKKGWRLLKDKNARTGLLHDKTYWDRRYKAGNSGTGSYGRWGDFKLQKIREVTGISSILDVGFGDLNMGLQVASFFPETSYLGLDISETALQKAKAKNLNERFRFKLMGTSVFSYPSDLVLCLDVLWHITQDKDYEDILESLRQSWIKFLFLTVFGDEAINMHTAHHMKIRKFDPTYFSEDYKKIQVPFGDKNTYLYRFEKDERHR